MHYILLFYLFWDIIYLFIYLSIIYYLFTYYKFVIVYKYYIYGPNQFHV